MQTFLTWLLGLQRAPDWASGERWGLDAARGPQGPWAVAFIGLAVLAIAGTWWLYRREGQGPSWTVRLCLTTLRLLAMVCVVAMLLEFVIVVTVDESVRSRLVVLVDTSQSMGLTDPYPDQAKAQQIAEQIGLQTESGEPDLAAVRGQSRLDLVRRAVEKLLPTLSQQRDVSVHGFHGSLQPEEPPEAPLTALAAEGSVTALGTAVRESLAAHRGQPIAGILLVSDGVSNTGSEPRRAATEASKLGVPIHTLGIGSEQGPSNAQVLEVETSPVVFVRDPVQFNVLFAAVGLQGEPATVTVEYRGGDDPWTEIARQDVTLGVEGEVDRLAVPFTPERIGNYDLRATIAVDGNELTDTDNRAAASFRVVRETIRVLLLAGHPAPEVQFLRNALLRDPGIEFASWLQSAAPEYEQIGDRRLRRLPATQEELDHFDVIVLFDPDMASLEPEWSDRLSKFVGSSGGGLIYVAGELNSRQLFQSGMSGMRGSEWLRTLPVSVDPGLYQSAAEVRLSSQQLWNLELTSEGNRDSIFRFAADPARNREVLSSLPGMYWHFPVTRAKPAATVLAQHGDPRMRNTFGRHVLMALHRYGPGWSMFIGFDSTYRWRYLDADYFDGFWARLIDRVGRSKALGGRYPFTLATDRSSYRAGDTVSAIVRFTDHEEGLASLTQLNGEVETPQGVALPLEWEPREGELEALQATFPVPEPGPYLLRVLPATPEAAGDASLRPVTLQIQVASPQQELDRPILDAGLLRDVSRAAGGQFFRLTQFTEIPSAFQVREVVRTHEFRDELWDAPLLFTVLVAALTLEWILRKRHRLA